MMGRSMFLLSLQCFLTGSMMVDAFYGSPRPWLPSTSLVSASSSFVSQLSTASSRTGTRRRDDNCKGGGRKTLSVAMHMGHSHSHHHHHHHDTNKNLFPKLTTKQRRQRRLRRTALYSFTVLATLFAPMIARRRLLLTKTDLTAFAISSILLLSADRIRREVDTVVTKLKSVAVGVVKHSPYGTRAAVESGISKNIVSAGATSNANANAADRVTLVGVVVNLLLSVGKFVVGTTCHSSALIADAGHSLSDLFSDFVTLWSVQIARLPPDDDHPYGHGKFEAIGSLFLAMTLLGTGLGVGSMANKQMLQIIASQQQKNMVAASSSVVANSIPTPPALIMALISICSKEWLYRITKVVGDKLNSPVIIANAWHHRSDAYSSILAFGSIGLAMSVPGLVAADAAAGVLVAGMICMTGADIFGESIKQLSDSAADEDVLDQMIVPLVQKAAVDMDDDVLTVRNVRARQVGSFAFVLDVSIMAANGLSTSAIRTVEERVRRKILYLQQLQQQDPSVDDGPLIVDAKVQATTMSSSSSNADVVVCPLLVSSEHQHEEQHHQNSHNIAPHQQQQDGTAKSDDSYDDMVISSLVSASQVEAKVRQLALLHRPGITSVQGVTVHYENTNTIVVDVDITVEENEDGSSDQDGKNITLAIANDYASKLRQSLEESNTIDKANIYLALNP